MTTTTTTTAFFFTLFFLLTFKTHSLTHPSDIFALKLFKSSIKPSSIPSFSCLASWNFTTDPCSVPQITHFICGLSCSASRITHITLDPAGYSGTLSPAISRLTQLTLLDLADNKFYAQIPPSIASLPNLNTLILRSNSFSGQIPSLSTLTSLTSLDFSHNFLSGVSPNAFRALTKLRRIDLSFNKLTGPIPNLPPNLIDLAIKANSLSGPLYKSSFDELTQLEVVELSQNWLSGTLPSWFFLLPSLQQVDLANNGFTRVEVSKPLNRNSDLIAVDLGYNKIEGYLPVNFVDFPLLSSLNLRYNRLRGPVPLEYSKKKTLRRLYLDGNFLNGSPPKELFTGDSPVAGSLGDNCLQRCPVSSELCVKSQKSTSICRQAYGGRPRT